MNIICPGCSFTKSIDNALIPKTEKFAATCPKCTKRFTVKRFAVLSLASNDTLSINTETHSVDETTADLQSAATKEVPETGRAKKRHLKIVDTTGTKEDGKTGRTSALQTGSAEPITEDEQSKHLRDSNNEQVADGGHGHGKDKVCCGNCSGKCDDSGKHGKTEESGSIELKSGDNQETEVNNSVDPVGQKETGGSDSGSNNNPPRILSFHGSGRALFGIYLTNMLLTIATLGIYSFWGKAKVRRYLYSGSAFMNERFTYTGTGKELLAGKIRASVILTVIFIPPQILSQFVHPALGLIALPAILFFPPIARTLTMRYRMSRSKWRGIQFSFRGTVKEAIALYMLGTLKSIVTLGYYYPKYYIQKQSFWRGNTWYGATQFKYNGRSKGVKKTIFSGSLLTILTLGVYGFWLSARLAQYNWAHTRYKGLGFNFTATGRDVLNYQIGNFLLIVFTLGFGMAWVKKRRLDFNFKHIKIDGDIDFAQILQSAQKAGATGESLATGLDIDFAM